MSYDPLDSDADPFKPPTAPTEVQCLHCGKEYESYLIEWRIEPGADGSPHGFWCCPTPGCDGRGFGFDILPTDPRYRDEHGGWVGDDEDDEDEDEFEDDEFEDESDEDESDEGEFDEEGPEGEDWHEDGGREDARPDDDRPASERPSEQPNDVRKSNGDGPGNGEDISW